MATQTAPGKTAKLTTFWSAVAWRFADR